MEAFSATERRFLVKGIEQNIRNDGRARLDYREFEIKTGVLPQSNGSARFTMDDTNIMVGVSAEITEPDIDRPGCGKIICSVECSPSVSPTFQGYGAQHLNVKLSGGLQRILADSASVDLTKLGIIHGKQCWTIHVDALVLDSAGNLVDSVALAARAALQDTRIPAIEVVKGDDDELEIEVSDDQDEALPFPCEDIPVAVSLHKVGSCFIVDPSEEEELAASSYVTVAVNKAGKICGIDKSGSGGISQAGLFFMMESAVQLGAQLVGKLDASPADDTASSAV